MPLSIPERFNGPPRSGNGGFVAGVLAEEAGSAPQRRAVSVSLRVPPPLETPMEMVRAGEATELRWGERVVAEATPAAVLWTAWDPVDVTVASLAEEAYAGRGHHPFPTCFVCGPERADGLRIFPGAIGDDLVASSWLVDRDLTTPDGRARIPVTWAALDCVGGWSSDLENRPMVLASMTTRLHGWPRAEERYAVAGRMLRTEGRKTWTATAMFDDQGVLVAQAEQLWIAVDWAVVEELART